MGWCWTLGLLVGDRWASPQRVPNEISLVTVVQGQGFLITRAVDH